MSKALRLLFLEDTPEDAELAVAALESGGYACQWERVETRAAFLERLAAEPYDVVISDYSLPTFDGLSAARLFVDRGETIPFILVSGTLGEEAAIESIKAGANDFVLKDKLFKLPIVVERALKEVEDKQKMLAAQEQIRLQAAALESAANAIVITGVDGSITYVNKEFETLTGYTAAEALGQNPSILKSDQHDGSFYKTIWDSVLAGRVWRGEMVNRRKDGSFYIEEQTITPVRDRDGQIVNFVAVKQDVSERNRIETENALLAAQINAERERLDTIVASVPGVVWEAWGHPDAEVRHTDFVSHHVESMLGYTVEEWLATPGFWLSIVHPDDKKRVKGEARVAFKSGTSTPFEFRWIAKDGRTVWVESHAIIVHDENNKPAGVRGVIIDITERRQAENERRVISEIIQGMMTTHGLDEFLKLVHRLIGQIVCAENCFVMLHDPVDDKAHFEFWADKYDPVPPPHRVGRGFSSYVLRSGQPLLLTDEIIDKMIEAGDAERIGSFSPSWIGVPLRTRSGTIGVLVLQDYENKDAYTGRHLDFLASVGDQVALAIERKRASELIEQNEAQLEEAQRQTHVGSWSWNLQTDSLVWSDEQFRIFGLGPGEIDPRYHPLVDERIHPDDRELVKTNFENARITLEPFDFNYRIVWPDGNERVVHSLGYVDADQDGNAVRLYGTVQDVTEGVRAAEALIESEERYRSVVETAPDVIITIDDSSTIHFVNPAAVKVFGYPLEEMKGASLTMLMPEYLRALHTAGINRYQTTGNKHVTWDYVELTGRHRNGTEIPITLSFSEYTQNGHRYFTGIIRDISERKRTTEALQESEERYRDLVENAIDIIYTHDLKGNYLSVNKAAEQITGYSLAESLEMNLTDTVAPEFIETAKHMVAAKLAGDDITSYNIEVIAKDGHRITLDVNTRIIYDAGVAVGVQGIARDVTERKQLEEQFRQSQKMEAVGVLAGGIAHDFNNLLTAISGYSDLTLMSMSQEDKLRPYVDEIKNAGVRAAALTGQLLAFGRKQVLKPRVHNLNGVITEIEGMLRRIIRENIEFRTVLEPELCNIKADPGQMEQVIMNLAVNARDAMPDGGTLTIETRNVDLDAGYASDHISIAPGKYVRMAVTDSGSGMSAETQLRIFEPFFTTKDVGKGTGLGLSTVHGIIKQSGGEIQVYSEIGLGTTFKIYLPCVDETIQKPRWIESGGKSFRGTETVLLVEDEEIVRNLVREILKNNGYRVLEATSGQAAISLCRTYTETIHLLLTDVIMPKMSGPELKDQIITLRPDIKVLFMSGYTDDSIIHRGVLESDNAFIEKPFSPDALGRKVREILD